MGTYYIPTTRGHGITRISAPDGTGDITIHRLTTQQTIEGFGAADVFLSDLTTGQLDLFFDPTAGIGLSIMRTGIRSSGATYGTYANAAGAVARGAKIMAAPWTAAAAQKDNGSETNGGHLLVGSYTAWATTLAAFQGLLQSNASVNLFALEVQNEPDFVASYVSMIYTAAEMTAFVKVLGPLLAALTPRPLLILPCTANWDAAAAFATDVLGDGTAAPYVDRIGVHQYAGTPAVVNAARSTWETEMSYFTTFDPTMTTALTMAADIHSALTIGQVTMWCYWWLMALSSDNEGLIGHDGGTQTTKRVYAMGNWSKFVRPGYVRVATTGSVAGVSVTAFMSGKTCVVVAINAGSSATALTFGLPGNLTTMTPWLTDATHDLVAQGGISVTAGVMATTLAALSVTSFVGTGA